jgi:large subunit ribosomal protein L9
MSKNLKLLLTENVEALGIVGDVVNVRTGYARNFLLPRSLATQPSEEKIKALAAKRAEAEKQLALQRKEREELTKKLQGVEVHLTRSCNDQGILYASITQQDIAAALATMGHAVKPRDVRINQSIKRVDTYTVHVKPDSDLDAEIKIWVMADRKLDIDARDTAGDQAAAKAEGEAAEAAEAEAKGKKSDKKEGKTDAKAEGQAEGKSEGKPAKKEKGEKKEAKSTDAPKSDTEGKGTWSRPVKREEPVAEAKGGKGDKKDGKRDGKKKG